MASVHFAPSKARWRVAWFRLDGTRARRQFRTEQEALDFAATITDERTPRRPGPDSTGIGSKAADWTPDFVRDKVRSSTVVDDNGCWIWQPKGGTSGYAQVVRRVPGTLRSVLMHRASYEAFVGPIPAGMQIDHLCNVTRCVNPQHLEPVTSAENNRRRDARKVVSA